MVVKRQTRKRIRERRLALRWLRSAVRMAERAGQPMRHQEMLWRLLVGVSHQRPGEPFVMEPAELSEVTK